MAVQWDLIGSNGPIDISPSSGTVYFGVGVDSGYIEFNVIQDDISEFLEMFHVQLINVTGGGRLSTLGDTVAVISIQVYNTFTITDISRTRKYVVIFNTKFAKISPHTKNQSWESSSFFNQFCSIHTLIAF